MESGKDQHQKRARVEGRIVNGADADGPPSGAAVFSMQLLTKALDPALISDTPLGPSAGKKGFTIFTSCQNSAGQQLFWCLKSSKFSQKITRRAFHSNYTDTPQLHLVFRSFSGRIPSNS